MAIVNQFILVLIKCPKQEEWVGAFRFLFKVLCPDIRHACCLSDMTVKLEAEKTAKCAALERSEKAEHTISMLELDVKNAQEEINKLKLELKTNNMKVSMGHAIRTCLCVHMCSYACVFSCMRLCACMLRR